jgi:hypothetical protein
MFQKSSLGVHLAGGGQREVEDITGRYTAGTSCGLAAKASQEVGKLVNSAVVCSSRSGVYVKSDTTM